MMGPFMSCLPSHLPTTLYLLWGGGSLFALESLSQGLLLEETKWKHWITAEVKLVKP